MKSINEQASKKIIECKSIAKNVRTMVKNEIKNIGNPVTLAVISVGDDPATASYIRGKTKACNDVGIKCLNMNFKEHSIDQETLEDLIIKLNKDKNVNGILVQLPLPDKLNESKLINLIDPNKDVDGLTDINIGRLYSQSKDSLKPCTPLGIMEILKRVNFNLKGKRAVVVGRSLLCGQPVAKLLQDEGATVTMAHSKTKNLEEICKTADLLIVAIGKAKYVDSKYIKKGALVVDVGINRPAGEKLCGDVDTDDVLNYVSYITPVPGGVGVMTVAMLLRNTVKAYKLQKK